MKIILFAVIFLLMNAFFIISNYNLSIVNPSNLAKIGAFYFEWIKKVSGNTAKITGEAVRLNWAPE